ncbi:ribonuclease III [Methylophilaceae bacterium 11]|jgi:ribonuclease-3|uniref:ribonuclease III n=1 Tax=unclassified Methylotenera TaxID=2643294 RepID=UPI00037E4831|nr:MULTISPECIES: ribonuclease III [unclassified Methylotenera]EUJ09990.1 ribonuclease III [Methylophilaceae bacterium 11]
MSLASLHPLIGYTFNAPSLLQLAVTHRSFSGNNNERLEFLGDGVLNFIVAHQLYHRFPKLPEGDLSRLRAQLVKESSLCEIALTLNLKDYLKLGEGELKSAGWRRPSILADALEAIVGAVYLDGGFVAAEAAVLKLFAQKLSTIDPKAIDKDAKSQLQEYLQSKKIELPDYVVVSIEGEAHAQSFKVECVIKKLEITTLGEGTSRRNAEQQAAQLAMEKINQ